MKKNLYYAISDGGDGSVSCMWFETQELADWYENNEDQGWGESSVSFITVESDSEMVCNELTSVVGHYLELTEYWYDEVLDCEKIKNFVQQFFLDGIPYLTVEIKDEERYNVMSEGKVVKIMYGEVGSEVEKSIGNYHYTTNWGTSEEDRQKQQDIINEISRKISEVIV